MAAYAELHCHSGFSFLDGVADPEELVAEAARLGLSALALTDHHGLYGAVRFAQAAAQLDLPTVFGAEVTLGGPLDRTGVPDPGGTHLIVLARGPEGYRRLSTTLAEAHLASGEKGRYALELNALADAADGHWQLLTGCRRGPLATALVERGPRAMRAELDRLVGLFGPDQVAVEIWDHGDPVDTVRNDELALAAVAVGVQVVATNNVHYATAAQHPLAELAAATRANRSLDELSPWLPSHGQAYLRGPAEQARRFARWPGAVEASLAIAEACAFDLQLVAPRLPRFATPEGYDEQRWLVELTERGATARYGPREAERVAGAWRQIDHELDVIGQLGFAGYFLTVHDITEFCRRENIYCQGRGSATNSAVCYALGITNADAVTLNLFFERFLSPARDGPPDIDVDIESGRREEVLQYVFARYGRRHAAQVANVITYRPRSAVRDAARALGSSAAEAKALSAQVERRGGVDDDGGLPELVGEMATQLLGRPRHLGIHSAGMVLCDRPVTEVCPVEWARSPGRSVLQWDKDDCAAIGLVKFDLLGLGMLDALHRSVDLVAGFDGTVVELGSIPQEPAVYDLLCAADTVGVFQVESRAQMGTLPRVEPRCFYDLVIQVALIRPGPIQGQSVNPFIRRRRGEEPVTYLHPLLEPILNRTLGVPLFQEQLMEVAVAVAGFSAAQADELRQAMAAKRSHTRMEALRGRLYEGMAERGVVGETADAIWEQLQAFANFGFPESHSVSFAHLVYCSAWMKLHHPAAMLAGLLNAQPMGFWSPQSLIADARRHGVVVERPDVLRSSIDAGLEAGAHGPAVRLGLSMVRGVTPATAAAVLAARPFSSVAELARSAGLTTAQLEALATAGALDGLDRDAGSRRQRVWRAGAQAVTAEQLPGIVTGIDAPELPEARPLEELADDLWAMGASPDRSAMAMVRDRLERAGVLTAAALARHQPGRVAVAGIVTHRQHPESARGAVFLNLEDETGHANVVFSPGAWKRWRSVASREPALTIHGTLERGQGTSTLRASKVEVCELGVATPPSRDFR